MTHNAANIDKHEAPDPAGTTERAEAVAAVEAAEKLLFTYLKPGKWPSKEAQTRFLQSEHLQQILALYERAMHGDPREPAYPWNLSASLDRLGLHDLALVYIQRAIRIATNVGDEEWADAHAHLALADVALNAGEPDLARLAIDRARSLDSAVVVEPYLRRIPHGASTHEASEPADDRDAGRKGKAVEHLIAATCMIASGFELNVSTSLVDDEGVDLVFHRRKSAVTLAVQVKSRSWATSAMLKSSTFRAQVRDSTFASRAELYLLFVAVDERAADYGPVWLVPSPDFEERTTANARGLRHFVASASSSSSDQWSGYRIERSQLPSRLVHVLSELESRDGNGTAPERTD